MEKTLKYLLFGALILCAPKVLHALTGPFVQITTGTLQPGTTNGFFVSSGTAKNFNVSTETVTQSLVVNSGATATLTGNISFSSMTGTNFSSQSSSASYVRANTAFSAKGTIAGGDATAGDIGEEIIQTRVRGNITYVTGTGVSVDTITLTAGDWDVSGAAIFDPSGTTTITNIFVALSKTANTLPSGTPYAYPVSGEITMVAGFPTSYTPTNTITMAVPPIRVILSGSQTYYIVAQAAFGTSTLTGGGHIRARRIR